jgi:hypothetical protein
MDAWKLKNLTTDDTHFCNEGGNDLNGRGPKWMALFRIGQPAA